MTTTPSDDLLAACGCLYRSEHQPAAEYTNASYPAFDYYDLLPCQQHSYAAPHDLEHCSQCRTLAPLAYRLIELGIDASINPQTGGGVHVVQVDVSGYDLETQRGAVYVYANGEGAGLYDDDNGDPFDTEGLEQISFEISTRSPEDLDQTYASAAIEIEALIARWRASQADDGMAVVFTAKREAKGSKTYVVLYADGTEIARAGGKRAERAEAALAVAWPGKNVRLYGLRGDLAKAEVEAARLAKPHKLHGRDCLVAAYSQAVPVEVS